MNSDHIEYLKKNHRRLSMRKLAKELGLSRDDVRKAIRDLDRSEKEQLSVADSGANQIPLWGYGVLLFAILAGVLAVYAGTLSFPFVNWDDPQYVLENRLIRSFSIENLTEMFTKPHFSLFIPLTLVSYAVDYQIYHFEAYGYHLTNLIFHVANAAFVFILITTLTRDWLVAIGVSLAFALHPVQVESVVWIAERKNVLSTFFFLLSFLSYSQWRAREDNRWGFYAASLGIFFAACFSKPNVVMLPLLLILFDATHGGSEKKPAWRYLPYFGGALIFAFITFGITRDSDKLIYHGGSFITTMRTMTVVMMKYLELLVLPLRQSLLYRFPAYETILHPHVAFSTLSLAAGACVLVWLWRVSRQLFFWAGWYIVLLIPVLNIVPFPSLMNDRYLYLPLIGFFAALFLGLRHWLRKWLVGVLILLCVFAWGYLNLERQKVWASSEALWVETQGMVAERATSPGINLGLHYIEQGKADLAISEFRKVLENYDKPEAYDGLGLAYYVKKDFPEAIRFFEKAIEKDAQEPAFHSHLALVYEAQEDYESAVKVLRRTIELAPKQATFRNNLGTVLAKMGAVEEAIREYEQTLELDPDFPDTLYNLGYYYLRVGRPEKTIAYWEKFLRIYPNHPNAAKIRSGLKKIRPQ
ncbi:MAG: tetratricopeptide repeat protein [Candidatus Omnitrophota bacterium]|nr:tetratricopeptide repeat protein [Candidatus Omnitrophota bacterium]